MPSHWDYTIAKDVCCGSPIPPFRNGHIYHFMPFLPTTLYWIWTGQERQFVLSGQWWINNEANLSHPDGKGHMWPRNPAFLAERSNDTGCWVVSFGEIISVWSMWEGGLGERGFVVTKGWTVAKSTCSPKPFPLLSVNIARRYFLATLADRWSHVCDFWQTGWAEDVCCSQASPIKNL